MIAANNTAIAQARPDRRRVRRRAPPRVLRDQQGPHRAGAARADLQACPTASTSRSTGNEFDGHDGPDQLLEMRLRLEVEGSDLRFFFTGRAADRRLRQLDRGADVRPGDDRPDDAARLRRPAGQRRPVAADQLRHRRARDDRQLGPAGPGLQRALRGRHARAARWPRTSSARRSSLSDDPVLRGRVGGQHQDGFPGNALFGNNQHGGVSVIFYPDGAIGAGGGAQTIHGRPGHLRPDLHDRRRHPRRREPRGRRPGAVPVARLIAELRRPGRDARRPSRSTMAYAIHYCDVMAGPGFNSLRPGAAARLRRRLPGATGDLPADARTRTSPSCSSRASCRRASASKGTEVPLASTPRT